MKTHKINPKAILSHFRHKSNKRGQMLIGGLILLVVVIGLVVALPYIRATPATMEEQSKLNNNEDKITVTPELKNDGGALKPTCADGQVLDANGKCMFPPCPNSQLRNNLGQCVDVACPSGQVKNTAGVCQQIEFAQPAVTKPCTPSGYIKTAYVRTKGNVGELTKNDLGSYPAVASYQFQVTSDCDATYYFEVGMNQGGSGLTILNPAGSKCDGNNHYSGRFITMNKNTIVNQGGQKGVVDIAFFPLDYGKNEKLTVVGGVYTGCFKDGGKEIDTFSPAKIEYRGSGFSQFASSDITLSWVKVN